MMEPREREQLLRIYAQSRTIAVVGASADVSKAAHQIPRYLQSQGYRILPVSPRGGELFGERVFHALPMHRLLSNNLLLLTFTGRKSGKEYTIPLGYGHQGNKLALFTGHNWYKNLLACPTVKVRLQGKERTGPAEVIRDDPHFYQTNNNLGVR